MADALTAATACVALCCSFDGLFSCCTCIGMVPNAAYSNHSIETDAEADADTAFASTMLQFGASASSCMFA